MGSLVAHSQLVQSALTFERVSVDRSVLVAEIAELEFGRSVVAPDRRLHSYRRSYWGRRYRGWLN